MTVEPKELLVKMKEYEFVYDTKIGQVVNKYHEEDKEYTYRILDLLHQNYDRVRYIDDMSKVGKDRCGILISQKFAMSDKRIPIPQVPLSLQYGKKPNFIWRAKLAYYLMVGLFQETDEEIYVSLNFRDDHYRKVYKNLMKEEK